MTRLLHHLFQVFLLTFVLITASFSSLLAQEEKFTSMLEGSAIAVDQEFSLEDDKFGTSEWNTIEHTTSVDNKVIFEIDEDSPVLKGRSLHFRVDVEIRLWGTDSNPDGSGMVEDADEENVPSEVVFTTLEFDYDSTSAKTTAFRSFWTGKEAHKMEVQIMSFEVSDHTGISLSASQLSDLYMGNEPPLNLIGEITVNRKYNFDCEELVSFSFFPFNELSNEFVVNWFDYSPAEEYDLEWTFYDEKSEIGEQVSSQTGAVQEDFDFLFRHNATRVTVDGDVFNYKIPLLYPKGIIFFRIRAARYRPDGTRETTKWSSTGFDNSNLATYQFGHKVKVGWHEEALNWQAQTAFAEEGKKVPSVRYFDGSLRERQSVTYSDAIKMTIVGETVYDHQGRPAVTILPTPSFNSTIGFDPSFNLNMNGQVYDKTDFDVAGCDQVPTAMSTDSGAARYYSPNNPRVNEGFHKFIPDAKGYPFTVTEYTPDLTGRIQRQSGVGDDFKFTSGHETRYFYGKPDQQELDRLFGSEVGEASHYFKNMVVDANGQVSVSYVDAHGRTIATALAGATPSNVDQLDNYVNPETIVRDHLNNIRSTYAQTSNYTLLVSSQGNYTFDYTLDTNTFNPDCPEDNGSLCYDCLYDLEIKISDNCGNSFNSGTPLIEKANNISLSEVFDNQCNSNIPTIILEIPNLPLSVGEYHITKTLKLSQEAVEAYADNFIAESNCVPALEDLVTTFIDEIDLSGCGLTCETCIEQIGPDATQEEIDACDELCSGQSECEGTLAMLMADMTPGGQYAFYELDSANDDNIICNDPSSIFFNDRYQTLTYLDEAGNPEEVVVNGMTSTPDKLNIKDFISYWKPSWAKALAEKYHPEYCYYDYCLTNEDSNEFDATLLEIETYEDAISMLFFDPVTGQIINDPFFETGGGGENNTSASTYFENLDPNVCVPVSMIDIITTVAYCGGEMPCNTTFGEGCDADNDYAWRILKMIYLGYKYQIKSQQRAQMTNCNNSCIGNPDENCSDCEVSNTALCSGNSTLLQEKEQRILNINYLDQDPQTVIDEQTPMIEGDIEEHCNTTCAEHANYWIAQLSACNLTEDQATELKGYFIEICVNGCDETHPFGSTTVKTIGHTAYNSFEEAIEAVLATGDCDGSCSANLINFPGPYEQPAYDGAVLAVTMSEVDADCVCTNLVDLESCYLADPAGYADFSEYLLQFSDVALTMEQINTLKEYCMEEDCNTFPEAMPIPPYLECNTCKTCSEVEGWYNQFTATCSDPNIVGYEGLLAGYLNEKLGMTRTAEDYIEFLANCGTLSNCTDYFVLCPTDVFGAVTIKDDCETLLLEQAHTNAEIAHDNILDSIRNAFITRYLDHCLSDLGETFTSEGESNEYHYTLYYYDQAGNLEKTIPPTGVVTDGTGNHTLPTQYVYNSLNEVVKQVSPDATESRFWYDKVGRLVVSQDGRQSPLDLYSYTIYDDLGRIVEVGEKNQTTEMTPSIARNGFANWLTTGGDRTHVTRTHYDESPIDLEEAFGDTPVTNLRNRVATVTFEEVWDGIEDTYEYATHYNYDATGNVKTLIQEIRELHPIGHGFKRIDYDYDYISGNVNTVYYQRGKADQFSHRYEYDENNRLINVQTNIVETNTMSSFWEQDARYEYYLHGPLARVVMGEQEVQGMDYAYNLQGWIKGVNSSALKLEKDMGQDGIDNTAPAKDAMSYTLGYYNGDYQPINPSANFELTYDQTTLDNSSPSLYNGNIRNMIIANQKLGGTNGYVYHYDQLHRIKQMQTVENPDLGAYTWNGSTLSTNYQTNYTYDPNGNLLSLNRNDKLGTALDNLTYDYYGGSNRLKLVSDAAANTDDTVEQVFNQIGDANGNNYLYDGSGNLTRDVQAGTNIKWTPYGKVAQVLHDTDQNQNIDRIVNYGYDAMQNRILKRSQNFTRNETKTTYYFRDAQGNVMSVYEQAATGNLLWKEQHLYGSSRLGILQPEVQWDEDEDLEDSPFFANNGTLLEGWKRYELSNHLGNVLSVINDRKAYIDDNSDGIADYYVPNILSATDYYPFGMEMAGRTFSSPDYRYGFNGKEKDKGFNEGLTHYDYGFRIYNAGIGKFLSVDPLTASYPMLTPYQFASNTPLMAIDLDGLEAYIATINHFEDLGYSDIVLTYDEDAEFIGERSFHIVHNYYEGDFLAAVTSGVASFDEQKYIGYFPDPQRITERSDHKALISLDGKAILTYGGVRANVKILGADVGFEVGGEMILLGYDGNILNSDDILGLSFDNVKFFDRKQPYDNELGASYVLGLKRSSEFINDKGYTGKETIEASLGLYKYTINSFGEESYKVEIGNALQYIFGYKGELSLSLNPKVYKGSLFEAQEADRQRNSIQQDNTNVVIPLYIEESIDVKNE